MKGKARKFKRTAPPITKAREGSQPPATAEGDKKDLTFKGFIIPEAAKPRANADPHKNASPLFARLDESRGQ